MPSLNFTFEEEVMSLCTKIDFIILWLSLLLSLQFQFIDPCVTFCHSTCFMPLGYEQGHIRWKQVLTTKHYQGLPVILIQTHSDTSHFNTSLFSQGVNSFVYLA